MYASAILILFLAFATANAKTMEQDPENGCPSETAPYKVIPYPTQRPFEKRVYPALHWVTTKLHCCEFMGYMRLFQYIGGHNSAGAMMNMTTPAVTSWDVTKRMWFHFNKAEVSFYIPQKFQGHPPEPTNPDVYLEYTPMTLFARTYTGYSTDYRFQDELYKLMWDLDHYGEHYHNAKAYFALYNGPLDYRNRRNEVWVMALHK